VLAAGDLDQRPPTSLFDLRSAFDTSIRVTPWAASRLGFDLHLYC